MTKEELSSVLELHKKWLNCEEDGKRANLYRANLPGADLSGANLYRANLYRANLPGADLSGANLYRADLSGANLDRADLSGANLYRADLSGANLSGANLSGANLDRANLYRADLSGANLSGANLSGADLSGAVNIPFIPTTCPDSGEFIGWKKVAGGKIVKLLIPEDAKRCSATGRKCRCNKAKVLEIQNSDGTPADVTYISSNYRSSFVYTVGETVSVPDFCEDRFKECAPGIHFFINRQEAVDY